MATRQLFRFAALRPARRRHSFPNLILGPVHDAPAGEFQVAVAEATSAARREKLARDFAGSSDYIVDDIPGSAMGEAIARLPTLIEIAQRQDEVALQTALEEVKGQLASLPRQAEARLWDGFIALAVAKNPPSQHLADASDALRVLEALHRLGANALPSVVAAALHASPVLPGWAFPQPLPGSPMARGIRPAGVADLLIVEERLLRYDKDEISFIENVMKTESKDRNHRRLDRTYDSLTIETAESEETERDLESTERSEVQTESEKTLQTEMSLSTGVSMSASYGPLVSVDTSLDASLGTSSETSSSVATTMAQDIVDRSVTKVSKSVRQTQTERRISETEEISKHSFDNTAGPDHVHGVYRWLEQVWEAQVMNYGRRLMMELVVPEPAALYREARAMIAGEIHAPMPAPLAGLKHTDITESNFDDKVAVFGATGVTPPPADVINVSKTFELPEREHHKNLGNDYVVQTASGIIDIPPGYEAVNVWADESKATHGTGAEQLRAHVGNRILDLVDGPRNGTIQNMSGPVEVTIFLHDFKAATVDIRVKCERTDEAFEEWQIATYQAIVDAHDRTLAAYEAEVKSAEQREESGRADVHPDVKRTIERDELKRVALHMLTNQDFSSFDSVSDSPSALPQPPVLDVADALVEGRRVLFFEHAFEWPQMTYVFYPYFWGRKGNWYEVLNQVDADPVFESFLKAGSSRVQIPVRPGFERAVMYFLMTGRIWGGGSVPVIGSALHVPIAQEISEGKDVSITDPAPYGDPWTYSIPTSLVWVDDDAPELGLT